VVRGRADALHGQRRFAVVTSRAVAPLGRLLEWSMPLVEPTGSLVAMKGSSAVDEIAGAAPVLRHLGCADPEVVVLGADLLESTTIAVRVAWADPSRVSWRLAAEPAHAPGRGSRRRRHESKRRRGA
jgi:16S rRNA (guanine527-N7)-methyltransferase